MVTPENIIKVYMEAKALGHSSASAERAAQTYARMRNIAPVVVGAIIRGHLALSGSSTHKGYIL